MRNITLFGIILLSLVIARRDCLQQAEPDELGRSSRPEKETFTISPSGHFYIHFDTTGNAAPDLADSNSNGVPDYIDEVGIIADSAHHVLVDKMGWEEEPFDGEGGYDIYIMSYAAGVYGYNYKDIGNTSYLQIDNDYVGYNSKFDLAPMEIMRITVGHEYFHGIQWGYEENLGSNAYFYEMTSMWFEDVLIPNGNDYLDGWSDVLLDDPTADFDNTGDGYELALFGHYLSSFLDTKGIGTAKNSTIIREMWERYGSTSDDAFSSVKYVLENNYDVSFIGAWVDFISRNLYNGIYEDMDNDFYYYSDQALIEPILTITPTINDSVSIDFDLDNESVSIQSYSMGHLNTIVEIKHDLGDYIGRVATVSKEADVNTMFWSKDTLSQELYPDDEIHFIYGIDQSSGRIFIDAIPHTVPIPPSGLIITSAQDSMILYWNPSPGPGDSLYYVIYRDGDSIFQTIDTNYTDSHGISGKIDYNYEITCYNEIGESQPSGIVSITSWPTENNVIENQVLSIYPNPLHKTHDAHILYALGANYSKTNLELINIRGQIVKMILLKSDQQGWHRERINNLIPLGLSAGIYIIRLQPESEIGHTKKITILP